MPDAENSFRQRMIERNPNFERVERALAEDAAGGPVTQRTVDTDEPIVVTKVPFAGRLYVSTGKRILTSFRLAGLTAEPPTVSLHVSEAVAKAPNDPGAIEERRQRVYEEVMHKVMLVLDVKRRVLRDGAAHGLTRAQLRETERDIAHIRDRWSEFGAESLRQKLMHEARHGEPG